MRHILRYQALSPWLLMLLGCALISQPQQAQAQYGCDNCGNASWGATGGRGLNRRPAHGWEGKRRISYQHQKDLFYNYYVGPNPSGAAAQLYVSPRPTPPQVGHTYVTYQPLMPHEYLYAHKRAYYTYNPGAGWTRTKVRYSTFGGCCGGLLGRDSGSRFTDSLGDSVSGVTRFVARR